jgi:hypothetical protein
MEIQDGSIPGIEKYPTCTSPGSRGKSTTEPAHGKSRTWAAPGWTLAQQNQGSRGISIRHPAMQDAMDVRPKGAELGGGAVLLSRASLVTHCYFFEIMTADGLRRPMPALLGTPLAVAGPPGFRAPLFKRPSAKEPARDFLRRPDAQYP